MKTFFSLLVLISATCFGQTNIDQDNKSNLLESKKRDNNKSNQKKHKTPKGFYMTAAAGESWESAITNNRIDTRESPTLGFFTYERIGKKQISSSLSPEFSVGYNFGNNLRAELNYSFKSNSAGIDQTTGSLTYSGGVLTYYGEAKAKGKIFKNSFMTTLYYDIPTKSRWTPYIGTGLGWSRVSTTDMIYDFDVMLSNGTRSIGSRTEPGGVGNAFSYQQKIGVLYQLSNKFNIILMGSYFHINRVDIGGGTVYEGFNLFGARAGLLYRFN